MTMPIEGLQSIFHEPARLAIVSEICASEDGKTFGDLKEACELTDGNLSRHLTALEKVKIIRIEKSFVGAKPRTTVYLTESGHEQFLAYLEALEQCLKNAARVARGDHKAEKKQRSGLGILAKASRA